MSKFNGVLKNNANISVKKDLREYAIKKANQSKVLEVFCGSGVMHDAVYKKADYYLGIDKNKYFDKRNTIVGDALSVINSIDISEFNIFDIDAYGSPYDVLNMITQKKISAKNIHFILTDGIAIDLRMGRLCKGLRKMLNIDAKNLKRAHLMHNNFIDDVTDEVAKRLCGKKNDLKIATGKTDAGMKYYYFNLLI